MIAEYSIFVAVVVLAVAPFTLGLKFVPPGMEFTLKRFGYYSRTLKPGLHFIVPFLDWVDTKMNMMEQVVDVPMQEIITKDNAAVSVDGVVVFQVLEAAKAAPAVDNLHDTILDLFITNLGTVMGAKDLDVSLSQRDAINSRMLKVIDLAIAPWGVKVNRVEVRDDASPDDPVDAMPR